MSYSLAGIDVADNDLYRVCKQTNLVCGASDPTYDVNVTLKSARSQYKKFALPPLNKHTFSFPICANQKQGQKTSLCVEEAVAEAFFGGAPHPPSTP